MVSSVLWVHCASISSGNCPFVDDVIEWLLDVAELQSSATSVLTYSQAILSSISSSNAPSSGSVSITISGRMFAPAGSSTAIRLVNAAITKSSTTSQSSTWKSDSSLVGKLCFGYGKNSFVLSSDKQASIFVFPAPALLTWVAVLFIFICTYQCYGWLYQCFSGKRTCFA